MTKYISLIFIILSSYSLLAQSKVDSLINRLELVSTDKDKVNIYNDLAEYFSFSDTTKTNEYANNAIQLAKTINYQKGIVNAYIQMGWANVEMGVFIRSIEHFNSALLIAAELNYDIGISSSCNGIGVSYSNLGEFDQALEYYYKSASIREVKGDKNGTANSYANIADTYVKLGDFIKALFYYQKSLTIRQDLGNQDKIADSYNNLGNLYKNLGQDAKALELFLKGLSIYEKENDKQGIAFTYNNIGNIYYSQEEYQEALKEYFKSLEIKKKLNNKNSIINTLHNIGQAYERLNNFDKALKYHEESLAISKEISSKSGEAKSLMSIGETYLETEQYSKALQKLKNALQIAQEINEAQVTSEVLEKIGLIYYKLENYSEAIYHLNQGIEISKNIGYTELIRDGAKTLAVTYNAIEDYQNAYDAQVLFKQMSDSIINTETTRNITRLEDEYEFQQALDSIASISLKEKTSLKERIKEGEFILQFILTGLIVAIISVFIVFIFYRQKKKANTQLLLLNEEISTQKSEIQSTLEKLNTTQDQLIQSEKMAALGQLVAGISHEINTPVGISVSAASHLNDISTDLEKRISQGKLTKSSFTEYLNNAKESSELILNNLMRASELVNSFKDVAVDQTSESKRKFLLNGYLKEIINSLQGEIKRKNVSISVDGEEIEIESYPGYIAQIFTNLIINSLKHGFPEKRAGKISINYTQVENKVYFIYKDDGVGVTKENLKKIFDPFFTTKRGEGGSGLGMHIVYNIIVHQFKGEINLESNFNRGVKFDFNISVS